MPETLQNLVSQPPLTTSIVDKSGVLTREWAIWFRDMYRRVAYKGGNAIDDSKNLLNVTIGTLEEAIVKILQNIIDIATNAADIVINAANIATNAANIATNAANIVINAAAILVNSSNIASNFGVHSGVFPALPEDYAETGEAYAVGDFAKNGDFYYRALVPISDPAGAFDATKWLESGITTNATSLMAKGASAIITAGALSSSFNIASLANTGTGIYRLTLTQNKVLGVDIAQAGSRAVSYSMSSAGLFQVEVSSGGSGIINILVSKVTVTTVSNLSINFTAETFNDSPVSTVVLTPKNLAAGDTVSIAIGIMTGSLPPA